MTKKKDFLSITDFNAKEIWQILLMAKKLKKQKKNKLLLKGKQMVMLFEKPSLRTKLSFDIGFSQLGGHTLYFGPGEVGLGKRESVSDVAKVISSMADVIVARVFSQQDLEEVAQNSKVPVINALSDLEHPCQALADFLTIWENKGKLKGLTLAYLGDGDNNVTHSLCLGSTVLGVTFQCGSPKGYWMNQKIVEGARKYGPLLQTEDPKEAVKNADVVYTDTWVSMGDEKEKTTRLRKLKSYQVNQQLMKLAKRDAIFMHDLPAYRDNEVTAEVIDGPQSIVFQQAENRLHVQKALLLYLLLSENQGI